MKRLLMVAYHFPPLAGSSGIQRTLRFVQHLPALGWEPIVLTAHPRAYEATSGDLAAEVPAGVPVTRAFALDTARHLSLFKRYPGFLARPDRWMSWQWGAVPAGLRLIRERRPAAIWSTYPIATAHAIGATLHRRSGVPWIADFRDPMAQEGYPADPQTWQTFKVIEETAVREAARCVFVTPGAARMYRERYPDADPSRLTVIENGYDPESFVTAEGLAAAAGPLNPGVVTLLHSGIVYPSERDPTQLFEALGRLRPHGVRVRFRAAVHDELLRKLAETHGVAEQVEILPPIPYRAALEEMLRADGLFVMQASNCNEQIPAKIYEYFRARRPILGLTDPAGDTAGALRAAGIDAIAPLDSANAIARELETFVDRLRRGEAAMPGHDAVERCSRRHRAEELAGLLDAVTS
jgi:glycosyltransferase involved in cell wall biosynthesis